jgi:hypothetical protein
MVLEATAVPWFELKVQMIHPIGASTMVLESEAYKRAFMAGAPRCLGCRSRDGAEAIRAATRRANEEVARLPRAEVDLIAATDPTEIVRLIVDGDIRTPVSAYRAAWERLVTAKALVPTHDIILWKSVKKSFGRTGTELRRHGAWRVEDRSLVDINGIVWCTDMWSGSRAVAHGASIKSEPLYEGLRSIDVLSMPPEQRDLRCIHAIKAVVSSLEFQKPPGSEDGSRASPASSR